MHDLQRHRRTITWLAGIAAAVTVASGGATAVLAEDPACVVDGTPITTEQAAADPTLCPAPAPAPEPEPQPTAPEPAPEPDPEPAAPEPVAPEPTAPEPTTTEPVAPTPEVPADPAPDPTTADPAPTTDPTPAQPDPTIGTGSDDDPAKQVTPVAPRPHRHVRDATPPRRPAPARPASPTVRRTHAIVRAKQYQAAPWRDARLFRENYEPKGRIPEQPQLDADDAALLVDAARGTGTSWATLAAVAWIESRWNDPAAGGILGRRLTAADWDRFGTDGDGDGSVTRSSGADQARTVATMIAAAPTQRAGLHAYFNYAHRERMANRVLLLSDYFDALGPYALVHGIDDPESRTRLQERTLDDERIEIYDGGRGDVQAGLVDPRVLVTLRYLANRYRTVTVSSMVSGHGVFTASGNVSLHAYGQAVDVAALGGEPIVGHQQRGGRTWHAVRDILLLPEAMQPAELITLWDMGGASFAMSDHDDHIHIGFETEPSAGG